MDKEVRKDEISHILEMGLSFSIKIGKESYEAVVRGWKPDEYILVDCKAVNTGELKIFPDNPVVTKCINKGFLLSCSTSVMGILKQPLNLLIIDYPTRYEKMPIRRSITVYVSLPALFNDISSPTPEGKNVRHKATTLDISLGGALIASRQKLELSQRIALSIKLSGGDKITHVISVVRNTPKEKKVGNETYYLAGIEYQGLTEENTAKLVKFIELNKPFRS